MMGVLREGLTFISSIMSFIELATDFVTEVFVNLNRLEADRCIDHGDNSSCLPSPTLQYPDPPSTLTSASRSGLNSSDVDRDRKEVETQIFTALNDGKPPLILTLSCRTG